MGQSGQFHRRLVEDWLLTMLLCAGILGTIALFTYVRYEGVLVPVLITLAGAAVLLLLGHFVHRPLVPAGYILVGLAVWLAVTRLVLLGLFALGDPIGMLGTALWILASAFGIFAYVSGEYGKIRRQEKAAAQARAELQERREAVAHEAAAAAPLDEIIARLPEAKRVSLGGEPGWRVKRRTFAFIQPGTTDLTLKLPRDEAEALAATDQQVEPTRWFRDGYVAVRLPAATDAPRWAEVERWIRTSYTLRAPKKLAQAVLVEDQQQR